LTSCYRQNPNICRCPGVDVWSHCTYSFFFQWFSTRLYENHLNLCGCLLRFVLAEMKSDTWRHAVCVWLRMYMYNYYDYIALGHCDGAIVVWIDIASRLCVVHRYRYNYIVEHCSSIYVSCCGGSSLSSTVTLDSVFLLAVEWIFISA
jgi:hypothetical protein